MKVTVSIVHSFTRQAKPLLRKYASLHGELVQLESKLKENPRIGNPIGHDCYKIRLAVKSKRSGKSGGLRVISHLDTEIVGFVDQKEESVEVTLLSIYDKNEVATISEKDLINLLNRLKKKNQK